MDNGNSGYGMQDPFQAAGLTKTNSYDMGGNPVSMGTTYTQAPANEFENNTVNEEGQTLCRLHVIAHSRNALVR
jgi:hypothetical protein